MTRFGLALLLATALGLSSCASTTSLPEDAREALVGYWESLAADPGVEHRNTDAWPGTVDRDGPMSGAQIWCVEAEMSSEADPTVDGSRLVWIVVRQTPEATWSAALLASLSAMWPYEACGWDLPG